MTVGEKIQKYRKSLGLSQEELGQKLLVSRQTISLWEKDQTVPTIDNLMRLSDIFGTSVDEILDSDNKEQNTEIQPNEAYQFAFTKEELNEIYRLQRKSIYKKPIGFTLLCIFLIVFFIASSAPDLMIGFAFGMFFIGTVSHIKSIRTYSKVWKNSSERICNATYEYKLFENYIEVTIYRQNEMVRKSKCYYTDIEQIQQLGKWLFLQFGGQSFIIRKSDLKDNSAIYSYMYKNPSKTVDLPVQNKWDRICKTSNIVLSVIYALGGWIFAFLGLMFFSLGFSEQPFTAICAFIASLLFLLTPIFCIFGILSSVLLRKKKAFVASFMIQFLPFVTLGVALISFFLSMIKL